MKEKLLVYACDQNERFFEYTRASFASFCKHHRLSEWRVVFADLGMHPWQSRELARFGEVPKYRPHPEQQQFKVVYPDSRAKLQMLNDFPKDNAVVLYLDSDTLIFDNLDGLVSDFVASELPIGILVEDLDEFVRSPASYGWRNHTIPHEFQNREKWRNSLMANSGVMLAQGPVAREMGQIAVSVFDKVGDQIWVGSQSIIVAVLYECEIPFMEINVRYNCCVWEHHLTFRGTGLNYVDTRPIFRGETVAIRHFVGWERKVPFDAALPWLGTNDTLQRAAKAMSVK